MDRRRIQHRSHHRGVALFVVGRKYIKWKITASYLVTTAVLLIHIRSRLFADTDLTHKVTL